MSMDILCHEHSPQINPLLLVSFLILAHLLHRRALIFANPCKECNTCVGPHLCKGLVPNIAINKPPPINHKEYADKTCLLEQNSKESSTVVFDFKERNHIKMKQLAKRKLGRAAKWSLYHRSRFSIFSILYLNLRKINKP